jgi:hypothetical protein
VKCKDDVNVVWCPVVSRVIAGLHFDGTVFGADYLSMLEVSIVPTISSAIWMW